MNSVDTGWVSEVWMYAFVLLFFLKTRERRTRMILLCV